MIIIGIDPGITNIGVAIVKVETEKEILYTKTFHPTKVVPDNLVEVFNYFTQLTQAYPIDVCSYEKPWQNNKSPTGEYLYYLLGVTKLVMVQQGIKMSCYPPTTLKKVFTGTAKSKKDDIKSRVIDVYGTEGCSNHVNDALALVQVYLQTHENK